MKKHGGRQTAIKVALLLGATIVAAWNILMGHRTITGSSRVASSLAIPSAPHHQQECLDSPSIYHIGIADIEGGVGTALYQLVINQLWYAETHQLTPWVHLLPNVSRVIDDPVLFSDHGNPIRLQVQSVGEPEALQGGPHRRHIVPGRPIVLENHSTTLTIPGDGIWNHYFHPVSAFDPSCSSNIKYSTTSLANIHLVIPGLHGYAGIRCWRYDYLPSYITRPHQSWTRWIADSRQRAAPLVKKYIRPLVPKTERVDTCLGLHIRHSDKAAGRRVVATSEFLPFAEAYTTVTTTTGSSIYVATDSALVLDEIHATWPPAVAQRVQAAPHMIRSKTTTAVFDGHSSHHRTNTEAIQEILALSQCQFLVHGHSAVSEAAIWTNPDLHETAVNLEDEHHLTAELFGQLVQMKMDGVIPADQWPKAVHEEEVWIDTTTITQQMESPQPTHAACRANSDDAVLWIRVVLADDTTVAAFFHSVLSQVLYAERNNLKPWIHLTDAPLVSDENVHVGERHVTELAVVDGLEGLSGRAENRHFNVTGNGIWNLYFEPVSDFIPGDRSCDEKPLVSLSTAQVGQLVSSTSSTELVALVKNVQFRPHLQERVKHVHATGTTVNDSMCLGVHVRLAGKKERRTAAEYYLHMEAYVRAGGTCIYLATDTYKAIKYIHNNFPESITSILRTQGDNIVRSEGGEWPTHMLDDHHRVNAETLVDVLALSKCKLLLHTNSTLSQTVLNINSEVRGVDIGDRGRRMSPMQFEKLARFVLGVDEELLQVPNEEQESGHLSFIQPRVIMSEDNSRRTCRSKVIVYLAQKVHSSYGRDSYSSLLRSLDLLDRNYLSVNQSHLESVDIFIFHTGDFNASDLTILEGQLTEGRGVIRLVDLSQTKYWARPEHQLKDRPEDWYAWPLFSEGYRRMMHWFAVDIWDFFSFYNQEYGCSYRYILRLDEDSFIHSPINYDIFDFMRGGDYVYGYRMCAYEMQVTQRMSKLWMKRHAGFVPQRSLDLEMCGFYNNFFVADLSFFQRPDVAEFFRFIDRQGHIYRRRLGDLMIHSMAVYWFSPQTKIHRFLDFTYEHSTFKNTDGCLQWGGIQAGYRDREATAVTRFRDDLLSRGCPVNVTMMSGPDLSPSYAHYREELSLRTVAAGKVEISGKGPLSG